MMKCATVLRLWLLFSMPCSVAAAFCPMSECSVLQHRGLSRRGDNTRIPSLSLSLQNDDGDVGGSDRRTFLGQAALGFTSAFAVLTGGPATATAAASATTTAPVVPTPPFTNDVAWPLGKVAFSLLPLAGTYTRRATVEECVVPEQIWTLDQVQGVVNVNVPVRQTVIKLSKAAGGGLLVYNPVAPTPQLLEKMEQLEEQHGPVRHIVLGTVALEHKATFGPFAQQYPNATVWLQPGQWAFPVGLPIDILGVTQRGSKLRQIPSDSPVPGYLGVNDQSEPEWAVDFDYEVLGPLEFESVGAFSETAMFHKATQTLLVTDAVVSVTDDPPKIIEEDPRAILFHARDSIQDVVQDTPDVRKKGWRRMVQFGLVFFPSQINVVPFDEAIKEARNVDPSMKTLGDGAVPFDLYPWTWKGGDADLNNFQAISKNGALFCPPILTKLILDREPKRTLEWVDKVCSRFNFERVIPCHLNNNVKATPKEFSAAFDVLRSSPGSVKSQRPLAEDLALLQKASDLLTKYHVVGPSLVCDGEPARVQGRFATSSKTKM